MALLLLLVIFLLIAGIGYLTTTFYWFFPTVMGILLIGGLTIVVRTLGADMGYWDL